MLFVGRAPALGAEGGPGGYRIVSSVTDAALVVEVVRVGHRREVYGRWPPAR